jgi:uncharacterized membrane protein YfcA
MRQAPEIASSLAYPLRVAVPLQILIARAWPDRAEALRWAGLSAATLVCAMVAVRHGGHDLAFMVAILVAAAASSIAGFAFSAICGAILFHISNDSVHIVQIMIACSIANQATMTWSLRHSIDWRGLALYLAGGLPGLALGVWFLLHAGHSDYMRAFGGSLLIYAAYMLFRKPIVLAWQPAAMDFVVGFLGGITGGATATPGVPVSVWCGMKGWDKTRQRAVYQPFILIMQIVALAAISLAHPSGPSNPGFAPANLLFIPASLLGTAVGLTFFQRLTDLQFARAVNLLLIVSGLALAI